MNNELIFTIIVSVLGCITSIWKYKDEQKKRKLEIEHLELENKNLRFNNSEKEEKLSLYDDVIKMVFYNSIKEAVMEIFQRTKVDRFLILIARNGKHDPKFVDVLIDFYKDEYNRIDAVRVYKNVEIDLPYKEMLKNSEFYGFVDLETTLMKNQILKHYYETENVNYSRVRPVLRFPVDDNNDFLVFTSSGTHSTDPFTENEKSIIDLYHQNTINPSVKSLLNNN